jgi:hypothetical protein
MAAGSASDGAGIDVNFAEAKPTGAAAASRTAPSARSELAADAPSGNIGTPARNLSVWRREAVILSNMTYPLIAFA